jgi:hypothetical protein
MTTIIFKNANRILIKENGEEININDGDIIQYTANYYKHVNDIVKMVIFETTFIGAVETCRFRYDTGIEGIYVKPLYIWDNSEWYKIINLKPPINKYFVYPHLLILSQYNNFPSCYHPIFSLNTCKNKSLDEFINIQKTFDLCECL